MKRDKKENFLDFIMPRRKNDALNDSTNVPASELETIARKRIHRSLVERLKRDEKPCIIAEMKRASPSAGMLCGEYQPHKIASTYEMSGAGAVSVLTEPHYFMGNISHLREVREAINLPVLRKDFISDSYQVFESAAWGADIILLITSALDPFLMKDLYQQALALGLEVLIESHSREDLEIAIECRKAILGINNRNLKTLKTDLFVGYEMADFIPIERLSIAESGIKNRTEIEKFREMGYRGFLIGEVLMRSNRPDKLLQELSSRRGNSR